MADSDNSDGAVPAAAGGVEKTEISSLLPVANLIRIMKRAIPGTGKISKEARACVQECTSEFIGFVTNEANERIELDKRRTISGEDVVDSLRALGFDSYSKILSVYLANYRKSVKGGKPPVKRGRKRKTVAVLEAASASSAAVGATIETGAAAEEEGEEEDEDANEGASD